MAEENGGNEDTRKWRERERTGHLRGRIVAGNQGKGPKPATRRRREQLTAKQINWRKESREGELVVVGKADCLLVVLAHDEYSMRRSSGKARRTRRYSSSPKTTGTVLGHGKDDKPLSSSPRPTGYYI